jgi:hypothetical protein
MLALFSDTLSVFIYTSHIANIIITAVKILLLSHISRNRTRCHLSGIKIEFEFWMCLFEALSMNTEKNAFVTECATGLMRLVCPSVAWILVVCKIHVSCRNRLKQFSIN